MYLARRVAWPDHFSPALVRATEVFPLCLSYGCTEARVRADTFGCRTGGRGIPARIIEVSCCQMIAHFYCCEHPAHFNISIRAFARHHGKCVCWPPMMSHVHVVLMFRHAVSPHWGEIRKHLLNLFGQFCLINAQRVWNAMTHCIHGVMRHVAMERPISRCRDKLYVSRCPTPTTSVVSERQCVCGQRPPSEPVTQNCTPCM